MSVTVGAALKKILLALLTDKRTLKALGAAVLGILLILCMPIAAVVVVFQAGKEVDPEEVQEMIMRNLTEEEKAQLQLVEDTMNGLQTALSEAGFPGRVKEAWVLYALGLSEHGTEEGFVEKLAGCFKEGQSDEQLLAAVNEAFGTDLPWEDFTKVMGGIRAVTIDTSGYADPKTKNSGDLVQWAIAAEEAGWGYVWGTYGEVLTEEAYEAQAEQYPEEVGAKEELIRASWLGRRTADCCGLIRGYGWLDAATGEIAYGTNGMPDISANAMYEAAAEKGPIGTMPELPGLAVWRPGHIGIYIGNGEVIEARSTKLGVVRTALRDRNFTHWLKIPYITYPEGTGGPGETEGTEGTGGSFWS